MGEGAEGTCNRTEGNFYNIDKVKRKNTCHRELPPLWTFIWAVVSWSFSTALGDMSISASGLLVNTVRIAALRESMLQHTQAFGERGRLAFVL